MGTQKTGEGSWHILRNGVCYLPPNSGSHPADRGTYGVRALLADRNGSCVIECSTPFGITDPFARSPRRHHAPSRSDGAQRLSASLILSHVRPDAVAYGTATGAQRLSASLILSHEPTADRRRGLLKCSTPFGITDPFASSRHLGASRRVMCSTPFGITDHSHRLQLRPDVADCMVLNAFRHH